MLTLEKVVIDRCVICKKLFIGTAEEVSHQLVVPGIEGCDPLKSTSPGILREDAYGN